MTRHIAILLMAVAVLAAGACDSAPSGSDVRHFDPGPVKPPGEPSCSFPKEMLYAGTGKDAIPALVDPTFVSAQAATYLQDDDRVLGFHFGGVTYAVPHNILKYHEIVNLNATSPPLAVTYCPLTGSGILFDRREVAGDEFRVSGLLYQHNLIMYDRNAVESLWPQMALKAGCGPAIGKKLYTYPVWDMTWEGWRTLFPATKVVSSQTGYDRDYTVNPYRGYDEPESEALLYGMPVDRRRPLKERVLGLPTHRGGIAIPFGELDDGAAVRVVHGEGDGSFVVFWDRQWQAAMAYRLYEGQGPQAFEVRNGTIYDVGTGSTWRIDGCAVAGRLQGTCLEPVEDAHVAFWFAWAAFHPETALWTGLP